MRRSMLVACAAALAASMSVAAGQELRGNLASGRNLAQRWCGNCHEVSAAAPPARPGVSSFAQVARLPSTTALSLRVFLRTTHADMPNIQLSEAEADDLIVYILSLEDK
jgi:mono/diheme cytochrome c family protein